MAEFRTVYLSSSFKDLKQHREAVYRALNQIGRVKVIAMEDYVARDDRPLAACLKDVADCDIYVGLFAWRYGFVPPESENPAQRSITELEYEAAAAKPRLVFVLSDLAPWPPMMMDSVTGEGDRGAKIGALRSRLLDANLATVFTDAGGLATAVSNAVNNVLLGWSDRPDTGAPQRPERKLQREVTHALYLAHHPADAGQAGALARELTLGLERPAKLSSESLFADDERAVRLREDNVIACHAAAALVTPQSLPLMLADTAIVAEALRVLRARSGSLALLLSNVRQDELPKDWVADETFVLAPLALAGEDPLRPARVWLGGRQPRAGSRSVGVPVCIVAMTRAELEALENDPALKARLTGAELQQFEDLTRALADEGIDWRARYHDSRHRWRPFHADGHSVRMIAEDIADAVGQRGQVQQRQRQVRLQWYPFDALVQDKALLRQTYRAIARAGCVVLVDEVSLFHPTLRETFQNSPFFNNDQVAIVTVSPLDPGREKIEAVLEDATRRRLAGAFDRYAVEFDPQCELAVGNERRFRRWLHCSLPATLLRLQEPQPDRSALGALAAELGEGGLQPKRDYVWGGGNRS
ncbi:MAG: DUF4062 domain-containing protein [Rhodocyclaceae bacterium]|nr:DUF4062 domain-containing protein [Rhodocyclaceae bacterium]